MVGSAAQTAGLVYATPWYSGAILPSWFVGSVLPFTVGLALLLLAFIWFSIHASRQQFGPRTRTLVALVALVMAAAMGIAFRVWMGPPGQSEAGVMPPSNIQNLADAQGKEKEPTRGKMRLAMDSLRDSRDVGSRSAEEFHLFPADEYPRTQRAKYEMDHRIRSCFVFDRPGTVTKSVRPEAGDRLVFSVAADFPKEADRGDSAAFRLLARNADGAKQLAAREWERDFPRHRRWQEIKVELGPYAGREVELCFEVALRKNDDRERPGPVCLVSDPMMLSSRPLEGPNVILLCIETLRRDHMSLYGYERETTPFLEELAKECVVFESAFSQSSWTRPSVASLLSGLYPSQHLARISLDRLSDSVATLPEAFREAGYQTIGLCTNELISRPAFNYDQGFDLFIDEGMGLAQHVRQDFVDWLEGPAREPFFAFIHLFDPHGPYTAPGDLTDRFVSTDYYGPLKDWNPLTDWKLNDTEGLTRTDAQFVRDRYDAEILYTDMVLRRFVEDLKRSGVWDRTLLVLTSDHGEEFLEHGRWGHGHDLHPEKLRVPLMIKLPESDSGGTRTDTLASGVDIAPTILETVDLPGADGLPGVNLLDRLNGELDARRYHIAEFFGAKCVSKDPIRYELLREQYAIIDDSLQYIEEHNREGEQRLWLFDLREDPLAQKDIAQSAPERLRSVARLLKRRYREPGYVIAANGNGAALVVEGTARTEAAFAGVTADRLEADDRFGLSEDGSALHFRLKVTDDDDLLRFQTEPAWAPVVVELANPGSSDVPVFIGPDQREHEGRRVTIPAERGPADAAFGGAVRYPVGRKAGLFIWRQGMTGDEAAPVEPDDELLHQLKDLGYL